MLLSKNTTGPVVLVSKELSYNFPFSFGYLAGYLLEKNEHVKLVFRPEDENKFREIEDLADQILSTFKFTK